MNSYEFKTEGQSVYFRPNDYTHWLLLCVAIDNSGALRIVEALRSSKTDFSILYQFQHTLLCQAPKK